MYSKATAKAMVKLKKRRNSHVQMVISDPDDNPNKSTIIFKFGFTDPMDQSISVTKIL